MTPTRSIETSLCAAMLAVASVGCADVDEADIESTSQALLSCGAIGFSTTGPDDDRDSIVDSCEQRLAERYAPIVYHSSDESNFPASVDWFLPKTALWFYDDACTPDLRAQLQVAPPQWDLPAWWYSGGCDASDSERPQVGLAGGAVLVDATLFGDAWIILDKSMA